MHAASSPPSPQEGPSLTDEARTRLYHLVLVGMVERGHGLDLTCFVLGLTRLAVLAMARNAGLADPVDKPLRRSSHPRAWSGEDYRLLAMLWLDGAHAGDIAGQLVRSKASIWAKRRYLGLPKRDRQTGHPKIPIQEDVAVVAPALEDAGHHARRILSHEEAMALSRKERRGKTWYVRNSPDRVTITIKATRDEVDWKESEGARIEAVHRFFAHQHPKSTAEDFGVSYSTIASLAYWLELPKRNPRSTPLVAHYDRNKALFYIKMLGYRERTCLGQGDWRFWGPERNGPRVSRRYKSNSEFRRSGAP
ncbi:MAG: hypothetical protein ACRYG8_19225 [Janthinobacterium lividum]